MSGKSDPTMLSHQENFEPAHRSRAPSGGDYETVRRTIEYISGNWQDQPTLDQLAAHAQLKPLALQRLFTRWAGLSPKGFLQAVTLDRARDLLDQSASVLDTSLEVGLSGPGRLHDLFVTHHAMTPGAYKTRGAGVTVQWGFHASPFGRALLMVTEYGLAGLGFSDDGDDQGALADMMQRWPNANFVRSEAATASYARRIFDPAEWREEQPLRVVLIGSDFELRVWETLLRLPLGRATTYSDVARQIGNPKAARAVGGAVGRNPISFVVPCHRVLGKGGGLGGYHWGLTRKRAILGWEAGLAA